MTIKELFSDPKRWMRQKKSIDANGEDVSATSPAAVRWCLLGGVEKCYAPGDTALVFQRLYEASERLYGEFLLSMLNDEKGYEAVMKVVEAAGV